MTNNVFTLAQIFAGRSFHIPDYQRGYSWEKRNCAELMEDIELLPTNFHHYTGTIVLKPSDRHETDFEGNNLQVVDVVDGQQRLTTLTLLLACIAEALEDFPNSKTLSEGIRKNYLYTRRLEDNQVLYRLTLNRDSRDFFKSQVLGTQDDLAGSQILSHKRLLDARNYFLDYFEEKENSDFAGYEMWLTQLFRKISTQLKMSHYIVESTSEVGVIFEVMNNRGKDLTELEKVKNYLLYVTSKLELSTRHELEDKINTSWRDTLEYLMQAHLVTKAAEDSLLQTHYLIHYHPDRKNFNGSKSIKDLLSLKKYIGRHQDLFEAISQYVNTLKNTAIAYADYERPLSNYAFADFQIESEKVFVREMNVKVKRLGSASFRPMLIACRLKLAGQAKPYLSLLTIAEKYAFRLFKIHGRRSDTGLTSFIKSAYNLIKGAFSIENCISEAISYFAIYSPNWSFQAFWDYNKNDNDWYSWSGGLKYLLYEYEIYLAKEHRGHVQFSWDYFDKPDTIEHVLPQTPTPAWKKLFTKAQIGNCTNDLGNLCLTLNNSVYGNKEFSDKKGALNLGRPCYANSSLYQEREIASWPEWSVESIRERRERITDWARKRWFVELNESSTSSPNLEDIEEDEDLEDDV